MFVGENGNLETADLEAMDSTADTQHQDLADKNWDGCNVVLSLDLLSKSQTQQDSSIFVYIVPFIIVLTNYEGEFRVPLATRYHW